jgi:hypothetical protein
MNSYKFMRYIALALAAVGTLAMAGCGVQPGGSLMPSSPAASVQLGKMHGGESPVVGATVTLYESGVGTASGGVYTGTATVMGTATNTTDVNGNFSFALGSLTGRCVTGDLLYLVGSGGNAGAGTNADIVLMAPIGIASDTNCDLYTTQSTGTTTSLASTSTTINEVTTVASAYAFSSFMTVSGSTVNIMATSTNSNLLASGTATNAVTSGHVQTASGLQHAFYNALNLANMGNGTANTAPPSNSSAIAPAAVVNTLANILQLCVNSAAGANCTSLFTNTPSQTAGTATNTLGAALNLARNPAASIAGLWALSPGISGAFSPVLSAKPNDWTLAIAYPVPPNPVGGIGFPFMLALDADDNVYVTSPENDPWSPYVSGTTTTNSQSACLFGWTSAGAFRPTISPYSGTTDIAPVSGAAGTPGTGTPGSSNWFCSGVQNADSNHDYLLANLAADNVGNLWATNYGTKTSTYNQVVKISISPSSPGTFTAQYPVPQQTGASQSFQAVGLAVDQYNDVWFNGLTSTSSVPNIMAFAAGSGSSASTGSALTIGVTATGPTFASAGRGLAFDSLGNFFGASYGGSSGNLGAQSLGGTAYFLPLSGAQTSASNYDTAVQFKKALGGASTTAGTGNNAPYGVAIDSSNNAWYTAGGAPGQTLTGGVVNGLFKCIPAGGTPFTTGATTCSTISSAFTAPKFLEADGSNVLWIADTTGIAAYASGLGTPAFLSESGGFKPCLPAAGAGSVACTYPDFNASIKGVAVDSTGSVWWTTPDTTSTTTNANMLIQMIGTGTSTWPILARQTPAVMP